MVSEEPGPQGPPPASGTAAPLHRSRRAASGRRSALTSPGVAVLFLVFAATASSSRSAEIGAVVAAFAIAAMVVGIVWPLVAVARAHPAVRSPRDATVGDQVTLRFDLVRPVGRLEVRVLDPPGPWHRCPASGGTLSHEAERRGVFSIVRVELACSAPLGLFIRGKVVDVHLGHEVLVAPRPSLTRRVLPDLAGNLVDPGAARLAASSSDAVRSVRPYAPGDPARAVHWPSSLRTGSLVVREMEPPVRTGLAVVLRLTGEGPPAEQAASTAMGLALAVLGAGGELVLATCEAAGPVVAPVRSRREAGRRLARAVAGEPGDPPAGWPVEEVHG